MANERLETSGLRAQCEQLPSVGPFAALSSAAAQAILPNLHHFDRDPGELIFQAGRPAEGLYIVSSGIVKLVQGTRDGARVYILDLRGRGDPLGEEALFSGCPYAASAKAISATQLCYLPQDDLEGVIRGHPDVALALMQTMAKRLVENHRARVELAYDRSEARMARTVLRLMDRFGHRQNGHGALGLELSRTELAELLGLRPETAIRILSDWRHEGLVELEERSLRVRDRARLQERAGVAEGGA